MHARQTAIGRSAMDAAPVARTAGLATSEGSCRRTAVIGWTRLWHETSTRWAGGGRTGARAEARADESTAVPVALDAARVRRTVGAALVATIAAGGLSVIAPGLAAADAGCAPTMVYFVPGTTETNPSAGTAPRGMLKPVADKLKALYGSQVGTPFVAYPALAFSEGKTYQESKETGERNLLSLMSQCAGSRKVLSGYSQGGAVAGDVAAKVGNSPDVQKVLGAALLADPNKGGPGEINIGDLVKGTGIGGPRGGYGALNGAIFSMCKAGDKWCEKGEGDNPISSAIGKILAGSTVPVPTVPTLPTVPSAPTSAAAVNAAVQKPVQKPAQDITQFATALQPQDFTRASLSQLPANVAGLDELIESVTGSLRTTGGTVTTPGQAAQLAVAKTRAQSVLDTLTPVSGALKFIETTPNVKAKVQKAAEGTPLRDVRTVSEVLPAGKADDITSKAREVYASLDRASTGTDTAAALRSASAVSKTMKTELVPLSDKSTDVLTSAGSRLSTVQPEAVTDQLGSALKLVSALNSKDITSSVQTIGQNILTGRIPTAQADATKLFDALEPIAKNGDSVQWTQVGRTVSLIPDQSGTTGLLGNLLGSLNGVDFQKMFTNALTIKNALEQLLSTGNIGALGAAIPAALELATTGARLLFSGAAALIPAIGKALTSPGSGNLLDVAKEGIEFGQFFGSGAAPHVQYGAPLSTTGGKSGLDALTSSISRLIGG